MPKKAELPTYVVTNPRNIPRGIPIITVESAGGERHYYEDDPYNGPNIEGFLGEGLLALMGETVEPSGDAPALDPTADPALPNETAVAAEGVTLPTDTPVVELAPREESAPPPVVERVAAVEPTAPVAEAQWVEVPGTIEETAGPPVQGTQLPTESDPPNTEPAVTAPLEAPIAAVDPAPAAPVEPAIAAAADVQPVAEQPSTPPPAAMNESSGADGGLTVA